MIVGKAKNVNNIIGLHCQPISAMKKLILLNGFPNLRRRGFGVPLDRLSQSLSEEAGSETLSLEVAHWSISKM